MWVVVFGDRLGRERESRVLTGWMTLKRSVGGLGVGGGIVM